MQRHRVVISQRMRRNCACYQPAGPGSANRLNPYDPHHFFVDPVPETVYIVGLNFGGVVQFG